VVVVLPKPVIGQLPNPSNRERQSTFFNGAAFKGCAFFVASRFKVR
jgi:hypothetical protein